MRALRLTLAYDGTDLQGWQVQPGRPTVQGLVMDACARILGEPVKVTGASRTDAGVHALRQVASLRTASPLEPQRLLRGLNAVLPGAVRVLEACETPAGFDARRSALGKRYLYLIDRGAVAQPLLRRERGARLAVFLSADSFLHHMVRNIVGSLVEIGRGARDPAWMAELLAGRDRTRSGPTAPAEGLVLVRVLYGRDGR